MPAGAFLGEYFVKGLPQYARRGLLGEIFDKLRIQGRMHFFEKNVPECFKSGFDIARL